MIPIWLWPDETRSRPAIAAPRTDQIGSYFIVIIGLRRGSLSPLVLGPTTVPAVTDVALALEEPALAVLSAVAHGNGPHGMEVVRALLRSLDRLDGEHGRVYFQIVFNALRAPMQQAMEGMLMERQASGSANLPLSCRG